MPSSDRHARLARLSREAAALRSRAAVLPARFGVGGAAGGKVPPPKLLYHVLTRIAPIGQSVENGPWESDSARAQLDAYPSITPNFHWAAVWTEDEDEGDGHGLPIGDASFWLMMHNAIIERDQQRRAMYSDFLRAQNQPVSLRTTAESIAGTRIETLVRELLTALKILLAVPFSHQASGGLLGLLNVYAPEYTWHVRADNHGRLFAYDKNRKAVGDPRDVGDLDDLTLSPNKALAALPAEPGQPPGIRRKTWREHNPPGLRGWGVADTARINKLNQDFPPANGALSRDIQTAKVMQWHAGSGAWITPTVPAPHIPDLINLPADWNVPVGGFNPQPVFPGQPQRGDVIGPWIFEDVRTLVNQCRYLRQNRAAIWFLQTAMGRSVDGGYAEMVADFGLWWSAPDDYTGWTSAQLPITWRAITATSFGDYQGFSSRFEVMVGRSWFESVDADGQGAPFRQYRTFDPPMSRAARSILHLAALKAESGSSIPGGDRNVFEFHQQGSELLSFQPSLGGDDIYEGTLNAYLTHIAEQAPSTVHPRFVWGDTSLPPSAPPEPASHFSHTRGFSLAAGYNQGGRVQEPSSAVLIYDFAVEGGFTHRPAE